MEDMRKRPGGDVTPDDASSSSSSPSAKRRRDQAAEEPPVSNDLVDQHTRGDIAPVMSDVVSVPPVANSGEVSVSAAVVSYSVDAISVPPAANHVIDVIVDVCSPPPVNDDGDILIPPAVNGGVSVLLAFNGSDVIGDISVPPAANDVIDVWSPQPVNDVGDISILPAVNGGVSVTPVFNDVVGGISAPVAGNGVVSDISEVSVPPAANNVIMATDDETLSELARLLDLNTAVTTPETSLTFAKNPSRSPRVFQTMSTSYVTINGNEESCGSSFSDADSSVMASVDWNGRDMSQVWMGGAWDMDDAAMWAREAIEAQELDADWDDAALARFLGEEEDLNPEQPGTN